MKRFSLQINDFLNELDINVEIQTYVEKISKVINELQVDIDNSNNNFENNDVKDDEIENVEKNNMLNYIFQSINEKIIAKILLNITLSKFVRIHFKNLIQCITQIYEKEIFYNFLIRLLCVRLRKCPKYKFKCDRLKKIKLN